ncbi:MAG: response regulator [Betaproteobacteria bacterium]|nr:response regulator [Betaproteobacteria bacterium]
MSGRPLLLVDDDPTFCEVLARALVRRGFDVTVAHDAEQAVTHMRDTTPTHAVVDLRMPGASGLSLVRTLREASPDIRIVVLTGYASIATAVEAIKAGATHYLAKPADADDIVAAFGESRSPEGPDTRTRPMSVDRLEWEHIQRVLAENQGNVSATARALGMHRRTLQRKLFKRAPRDSGAVEY